MKKLLVILCATALPIGAYGQGLVKFGYPTITFGPGHLPLPPSSIAYFTVLSAPAGSTDWTTFSFANIYGTNSAGGIVSGSPLGATVSGWAPAETRAFEVVGWIAPSWVAYSPNWLTAGPAAQAASGLQFFGHSMIAEGSAGGPDPVTGLTIPALALFSGSTISSGLNLDPLPEPSIAALAGLGAAALLLLRRRGPIS